MTQMCLFPCVSSGSEAPDVSNYLYDATSGFYYDPETTLYYDPGSRVSTSSTHGISYSPQLQLNVSSDHMQHKGIAQSVLCIYCR